MVILFPDGAWANTSNDALISFVDFAPTVLSLAGIQPPSNMQGQAFWGPYKMEAERTYVYAARDRMDPVMDYVRAVRDKRYKLIKNYWPDQPYVQFLPYRDQMPLMQQLLKMDSTGELKNDAALWFAKERPELEFYDLKQDPHEVNNLALNPSYQERITLMLKALEDWQDRTGDMGGIPEPELVRQLWPPAGQQPQTQPCQIQEQADGALKISSQTPGASMAYRVIGSSDTSAWQLYSKSINKPKFDQIEALAHRIGYLPSKTTIYTP